MSARGSSGFFAALLLEVSLKRSSSRVLLRSLIHMRLASNVFVADVVELQVRAHDGTSTVVVRSLGLSRAFTGVQRENQETTHL